MNPNNVLIFCPSGHQLQAAAADLGQPLLCPICNVTFTPAIGPQRAANSPVYPAPAMGYAGYPAPTSMVTRPGYVTWLIGLQLAVMFVAIMLRLLGLATGGDPNNPNPLAIGGVCVVILLVIPLFVLELMWIYRIHQDAQRARGYSAVSPGLALGLSFIPFFNGVWPPWTMKRLMDFVVEAGGETTDPKFVQALRLARTCFYTSIIWAVALFGSTAIGFVIGITTGISAASQGGPPPGANLLASHPGLFVLDLAVSVLGLAFAVLFVLTIRRVTSTLYDFLGAPP